MTTLPAILGALTAILPTIPNSPLSYLGQQIVLIRGDPCLAQV